MDALSVFAVIVLLYFLGIMLFSLFGEIAKENAMRKKDPTLKYNETVDDKLNLLMERFHIGELDVYATLNNLSFIEDGNVVAKVCTDILSDSPYGSFRNSIYYGKHVTGAPSWKTQLALTSFRKMIVSRATNENTKLISNKKISLPEPEEVQL